jgi:hypothetical protein
MTKKIYSKKTFDELAKEITNSKSTLVPKDVLLVDLYRSYKSITLEYDNDQFKYNKKSTNSKKNLSITKVKSNKSSTNSKKKFTNKKSTKSIKQNSNRL